MDVHAVASCRIRRCPIHTVLCMIWPRMVLPTKRQCIIPWWPTELRMRCRPPYHPVSSPYQAKGLPIKAKYCLGFDFSSIVKTSRRMSLHDGKGLMASGFVVQ